MYTYYCATSPARGMSLPVSVLFCNGHTECAQTMHTYILCTRVCTANFITLFGLGQCFAARCMAVWLSVCAFPRTIENMHEEGEGGRRKKRWYTLLCTRVVGMHVMWGGGGSILDGMVGMIWRPLSISKRRL